MGVLKSVNKVWNNLKTARETCTIDVNKSPERKNLALYAEYYSTCKVNDNLVLYMSYWGRGIIDNPYAIFQELLKRPEYKNLKHIWVLEDFEDNAYEIEKYSSYTNVSFVQINTPEYFKALCEAKYLINNVTFPYWFIKKEEQIYVNTWHGTPLKSMGYEMVNGISDSANTVRNFLCADYLLSANEVMTNMYMESYKMHEILPGEILEEGYPRNDVLRKPPKEKIFDQLEKYGISLDRNKKIILYAPTWRQVDASHAVVNPDELLDVKRVLEQHIDTDKYQILIKPHQYVYKELKNREEYRGLLIPAILDANEILSIADILISDFSSIFMDFTVTGRPVLFYIPDLQEYMEQRGVNITIDKLPGPYSDCVEEIAEYVNCIDEIENTYRDKYQSFQEAICQYDDGNVSSRVVDIIFGHKGNYGSIKAKKTKKTLLISTGTFLENGITHSLLSLLNVIDYDQWDVTAFVTAYNSDEAMQERLNQINPNVRVLVKCGRYVATLKEEINKNFCTSEGLRHSVFDKLYPWNMLKREFHRNFGNAEFDYIVDFSGYDSTVAPMMLCGNTKKRSIWLHNDIEADMNRTVNGEKTIYRSLHFNVTLYPKFDHLVSCSKSVMEVNREKLSTPDTYDKYTYASNTVDVNRIKKCLNNEDIIKINDKEFLVKTNLKSSTEPRELNLVELPKRDIINFVTMGRMSTEKNQIALIRAFARFHEDCQGSQLYIIGDGPLRDQTEEVIRELNLNKHVTLTGNIDNPFAVMKRCSCFILPSLHEGQPMVLLEARACGLPIIVSNFSTVKDSLYPNGQLLINHDEDSIYEGLCAFARGEVPVADFDLDQNNQKAYEEFLQAIM